MKKYTILGWLAIIWHSRLICSTHDPSLASLTFSLLLDQWILWRIGRRFLRRVLPEIRQTVFRRAKMVRTWVFLEIPGKFLLSEVPSTQRSPRGHPPGRLGRSGWLLRVERKGRIGGASEVNPAVSVVFWWEKAVSRVAYADLGGGKTSFHFFCGEQSGR